MEPIFTRPQWDGPRTRRAKKSLEVPTPLQDALQIPEYQRQRVSEKLRVEKELFPECIQAPAKYYNRRKTLNLSKRDKENRHSTIFPGEETSSSDDFIMNKSRSYVQEWLNKQPRTSFGPQPRSPFSDLKVNTQHNQVTHSTPVNNIEKENVLKSSTRQSSRKRSRLKQAPSTSQTSLENYLKPVEKGETKKAWSAKRLKQEFETNKHVESKRDVRQGNKEIENEECYTIEDTQDQIVDKDKMALLEVYKANMKEITETVVVIGDTEESSHLLKTSHVPFLKKSNLYENCAQCKDSLNIEHSSDDNTPVKSNDVSITIENKSFVATISIVDCNIGKKHSTAVQTDAEEPFIGFEQPAHTETTSLIAKMKEYIATESVASEGMEQDSQKTSCTDVVLDKNKQEDEADGNMVREDNTMAAFGHSSEHDFGVLNPLRGAGFQNKRPPRRGATPDSNNSSDKENCDPNRKKRHAKKKKTK